MPEEAKLKVIHHPINRPGATADTEAAAEGLLKLSSLSEQGLEELNESLSEKIAHKSKAMNELKREIEELENSASIVELLLERKRSIVRALSPTGIRQRKKGGSTKPGRKAAPMNTIPPLLQEKQVDDESIRIADQRKALREQAFQKMKEREKAQEMNPQQDGKNYLMRQDEKNNEQSEALQWWKNLSDERKLKYRGPDETLLVLEIIAIYNMEKLINKVKK